MNNQQRLQEIEERLEILKVMDNKINIIISMLSDKRNSDPNIEFTKANNVENTFIQDRQKELFSSLDYKGVK